MIWKGSRERVLYTRNFILRSMCAVYMVAFLGIYYQCEGLFGNNGVSPVVTSFKANKTRLNLLHFADRLGLDLSSATELLSLIGTVVAFVGFVSRYFISYPLFASLWLIYFSLSEVMGGFLNQADLLLLEAGVICIILAPANTRESSPSDQLGLLIIRWLLFRFIFSSGVVKLASNSPHWWRLEGLERHLETMPLPTQLTRFSFHIPSHLLKLTMVYVFVSELVVSFLFLAPILALRKLAFYWHLFLQFHIIATGNFGHLNFLIVVLLFALINDSVFYSKRRSKMDAIIIMVALAVIGYGTCYFFGIGWNNGEFAFRLQFDKGQYAAFMKGAILLAPTIALITILSTFLNLVIYQASQSAGIFYKMYRIFKLCISLLICITLLCASVVPIRNLHPETDLNNTNLGKNYHDINQFRVVNDYGQIFKKVRSERLEIVMEFANVENGPWVEYPMVYKPTRLDDKLASAGPYLPRLDYVFWAAAPSNIGQHPWLMALTFRLLQGESAVLRLTGASQTLMNKKPRFVRAMLYRFKYTPWEQNTVNYWTRQPLGEFMPAVSLESSLLHTSLKQLRIPLKNPSPVIRNQFLKKLLDQVRSVITSLEGSVITFSLLASGFALIATKKTD